MDTDVRYRLLFFVCHPKTYNGVGSRSRNGTKKPPPRDGEAEASIADMIKREKGATDKISRKTTVPPAFDPTDISAAHRTAGGRPCIANTTA